MKKQRWQIIHEDDSIIVVNKPAGLLTIPDRYDNKIENLYTSLQSYRDSIFINHRLDRETSGLLVFSKTESSHKYIQEQFESRKIKKSYHAIVKGSFEEEKGKINLNISKNTSKKKMVVDPKGKTAISKYQVLEDFGQFSLIKVDIDTGRTHQIRVHMQAVFLPLLCDPIYGDGQAFYLSKFKKSFRRSTKREEKPLLSRHALHSFGLSFKHPETKKKVSFEQEVPKDMRAVISQLRKIAT